MHWLKTWCCPFFRNISNTFYLWKVKAELIGNHFCGVYCSYISRCTTRDFLIIAFLWSNWREVSFLVERKFVFIFFTSIVFRSISLRCLSAILFHFILNNLSTKIQIVRKYIGYILVLSKIVFPVQKYGEGKDFLSCSTKLRVSLFNLEGEGYILICIFSAIKLVLIAQVLII